MIMWSLAILLLVPNLNAETLKFYTPKAGIDVPAEVELLLRSLSPTTLLNDEKTKLNAFTTNFSRYQRMLDKPELYFVAKTEAMKLLLASRPKRSVQYQNYNIIRLTEFENASDWPAYSPWAQFAFQSLIKDAKILVSDPRFPSLWKPIEASNSNADDLSVFRKRVELILSWIDYFAFTSVVAVNSDFEKLALTTLGRIERAAWILSSLSKNPEPKENDNIFELKEIKTTSESPKTAKESLDKIVDPIVETAMPKLPNPVNDWVPREIPNTPFTGPNIIKNKDPFYSAPVQLPKPTNDWIMSL